ncbi:MAG TPA: response regulator transcription factor [Gemmatimonadaceae bacterium]|nr:response regulator transcription factor [Gemmatimonadaceae bacterium]
MRILVVEREDSVAGWLRHTFGSERNTVDVVSTAAEAAEQALSQDYDVVVMDIDLGLADQHGQSAVAKLRRMGGTWPVIVVSANGEDRSIIDAVNAGADDYLVKPVSEAVLVAHIRAVLRRSAPTRPDEIHFGDVVLNRNKRYVTGAQGEATLTAKEYGLLELFLSNPDRVVPRAELLARVWGFTFEPRTSVVEVAVSRVRRKLAQVSSRVRLHALRNVGFVATDERSPVSSNGAASPNGHEPVRRTSGNSD